MDKPSILKACSLAGFVCAVVGLLYLLKHNYLISANYLGMGIQISAVALMLWARLTFGARSFHPTANTTNGQLITHGPFRWFRHPIYASIIYFVWAGVASFPFAGAIAAAVLITAGLTTRILLEETFLRETYPEYVSYSKKTKRVIPFVF